MTYYSGSFTKFLSGFHAIIGNRDSGKTTILKQVLSIAKDLGYTIILFDSATDHESKSLLMSTKRHYPGKLVISSPKQHQILDDYPGRALIYPYDIIRTYPSEPFYLFDVSKYLEQGYDTEDLTLREQIRMYYKKLVQQELYVLYPFVKDKKSIILMDEIELIPSMQKVLQMYQQIDCPIIDALHQKSSLAGLEEMFEVLEL